LVGESPLGKSDCYCSLQGYLFYALSSHALPRLHTQAKSPTSAVFVTTKYRLPNPKQSNNQYSPGRGYERPTDRERPVNGGRRKTVRWEPIVIRMQEVYDNNVMSPQKEAPKVVRKVLASALKNRQTLGNRQPDMLRTRS